MNEHVGENELPELSDEDVELLYAICKRASSSPDPPFKALFSAYDYVFAEQRIQQHHDGVVFRVLMRVGESTRAANREGRALDLVQQLRDVLEAQGITVIAPSEDGVDEHDEPFTQPEVPKAKDSLSPRRRVSFDDARLEETWLSEHSASISLPLEAPSAKLMRMPPRRGRIATPAKRSRSTSSQRGVSGRNATLHHLQYPPIESHLDADEPLGAPPLPYPSQTQLEQNAEVFAAIIAFRSARQALHLWHDALLRSSRTRAQDYSAAVARDRATLLTQAIGQWRAAVIDRTEERSRLEQLKRLDERAFRYRNLYLLTKAFTHWATSSSIERIRTAVAQRHVLKVTYFKRWRAIANTNQMKSRKILATKYVAVWREKTARRVLWQEQAVAHYEGTLMRKCEKTWFWRFCSQRVEGWHDENIQRKAFRRLMFVSNAHRQLEHRAEEVSATKLAWKSMRGLQNRLKVVRSADTTAERHQGLSAMSKALAGLQTQLTLAPFARTITSKVSVNLKRKALMIWQLHHSLSRQASVVNDKRILQRAWTNWNDALRCTALAQKIDERVLVENLYRWVLQERLTLFRRTTDSKLLGRAWIWWISRIQNERNMLAEAEVVFTERQRRSRLAFGMLRLNAKICDRENAERLAVEALNSRILPRILDTWTNRAAAHRKRSSEAADARFYFVCTSTLKIWQMKTSEQKQNRRRDAYVQVRAKVKVRLVGDCFMQWRSKATEVHSMHIEVEQRTQARDLELGTLAFQRWQDQVSHSLTLNLQATDADRQKLVGSAFSALASKHADLAAAERKALCFRHDTDRALTGGALRSIQWATFTATRKVESAEALWTRNRDQHVKHMLRHWAAQVVARRNAPAPEGDNSTMDEPESPSIRPGSRAASRSAGATFPSSPPVAHSTPAYLRTPSRPRRAGRFRPLPTPAQITPMAFDTAYLITTPAPLVDAGNLGGDQSLIGLTPQVTPFQRKLRAGGFAVVQPSTLRRPVGFDASNAAGGTGKSVRFAGGHRF